MISPQCHAMHDELFSTAQGSLTDAVFDRATWTQLLELNGLQLTLGPADSRGSIVPFEEFYDNFVDLTSDDMSSSPSVPERDADMNSVDLNSSDDNSSPAIATSSSDDTSSMQLDSCLMQPEHWRETISSQLKNSKIAL